MDGPRPPLLWLTLLFCFGAEQYAAAQYDFNWRNGRCAELQAGCRRRAAPPLLLSGPSPGSPLPPPPHLPAALYCLCTQGQLLWQRCVVHPQGQLRFRLHQREPACGEWWVQLHRSVEHQAAAELPPLLCLRSRPVLLAVHRAGTSSRCQTSSLATLAPAAAATRSSVTRGWSRTGERCC